MSLDVYLTAVRKTEVFSSNITHNLGFMAKEAGIYQHLWHPDELGILTAQQLIEPLSTGLRLLESHPERFKRFDAKNGWGTYQDLCRFVRQYLEACKDNPDATVSAWV